MSKFLSGDIFLIYDESVIKFGLSTREYVILHEEV